MNDWKLLEIAKIIAESEEVQKSDASGLAKQDAKLSAYDDIKNLITWWNEREKEHGKIRNRTEDGSISC